MTRPSGAAGVSVLVGALLFLAGALVAATSVALRGDDGLVTAPPVRWSTAGHALAVPESRVDDGPVLSHVPRMMVGRLRVVAEAGAGHEVFLGVARTRDVEDYLGEVARTTVTDPWNADGTPPAPTVVGSPLAQPATTGFWLVAASGPGPQSVEWTPRAGDWTLVVMNDDGTAPVTAEVTVAAELPVLSGLALALLVSGVLALVVAGVTRTLASRG